MSAVLVRPLLLALLVVLAACGQQPTGGPPAQGTPGQAGPLRLGDLTFNDHGMADVTGQSELELEADSYYFAPTFLRGAPGQKLKLAIENESGALHNLSIPEQRIDRDVQPRGRVEVEVTFPQSGALRFYCKYHVPQGMNGELLAGAATPQPVSPGVPATRPPAESLGY